MSEADGLLPAVSRLRAALEETAEALSTASVDRLLAADARVRSALGALAAWSPVGADERAAVRRELEAVHAALVRCRTLGGALSDFVRFTLGSHGPGVSYGPGRDVVAPHGAGLEERA